MESNEVEEGVHITEIVLNSDMWNWLPYNNSNSSRKIIKCAETGSDMWDRYGQLNQW